MGNCTVTVPRRRETGITPTGVGKIVDIALSTSYATGGDTVPLASLGVSRLAALILQSGATSPAGHAIEVVNGANEATAPLLRIRDVATGTEITSTTNLSAQTIRAVVYGDMPNP